MSDNTSDSGGTAEPRVRKRATKKTAGKAVKADAPAQAESAPAAEQSQAAPAAESAKPSAEPAKKHGDALAPAAEAGGREPS